MLITQWPCLWIIASAEHTRQTYSNDGPIDYVDSVSKQT